MNSKIFTQEINLLVCNDVCSIVDVSDSTTIHPIGVCFIDPSKVSLKAVFLHNGNKFPSVLLA
jgi:hypothetical protein